MYSSYYSGVYSGPLLSCSVHAVVRFTVASSYLVQFMPQWPIPTLYSSWASCMAMVGSMVAFSSRLPFTCATNRRRKSPDVSEMMSFSRSFLKSVNENYNYLLEKRNLRNPFTAMPAALSFGKRRIKVPNFKSLRWNRLHL